jgi:hypothetical protein
VARGAPAGALELEHLDVRVFDQVDDFSSSAWRTTVGTIASTPPQDCRADAASTRDAARGQAGSPRSCP